MNRAVGSTCLAFAVGTLGWIAAAASPGPGIPLKNHSFTIDAGDATLCTDGAIFDGSPTASSALGLLMTSEVWDATGTTLLATGNTHTFSAVGETFTFTVLGSFTAGSTILLSVNDTPGTLPSTEGDADTATVADCTLPAAPAMPAWGLALLALALAAGGGLLVAAKDRRLARPLGLCALLVLAGAAAAGATVSPPGFSKVFVPDTIGPGSTSMLVFEIDNTNNPTYEVDMLAFDDELPDGMSLAEPAFVSNDCGGTLTFDENDSDTDFDIRLTGGMIGTGAVCTIVVNVTAGASDASDTTYMNESGDLTSDAGNSGTATDDLMVDVDLPGFSKSFAPNPVEFGGRSTLTFLIDNSDNPGDLVDAAFTDTLPAGMVIADPTNASTDCGTSPLAPTLDAVAGSSSISFTYFGTGLLPAVAAEDSCTVVVDVIGQAVGLLGNVSSELDSSVEGGALGASAGKAAAVLEVTGFATLLQITKQFTDDPVPPGGTVDLEFTILNKSRDDAATGITFTDDLDATLTGLAATVPGTPDPPCGTGSSLAFASGVLTLTGGNLPAEGSCTFSVAVSVPAGATPSSYPNTTGAVSGMVGGSPETGNMAGDILFVVGFPVLTKSFTDDPVGAGGVVTLEFTLTNADTTTALSDVAFVDVLPDIITTSPSGPPAANFCGTGSTAVFTPRTTLNPATLTVSDARLEKAGMTGDSCTFSLTLDVVAGAADGAYPNTTSTPSGKRADIGGTPTVIGKAAKDDLVVVGGPQLAKVFTDDPVAPGGTVTLEFTLSYESTPPDPGLPDATGIGFTDDLAAISPAVPGLVATGLPLTDVCGPGNGTLSGSAGNTFLTFSGATLEAEESCTFSVVLSVPGGATPGLKTNTTSKVSATVSGVTTKGAEAEDKFLISGFRILKEFTDDPVIAGDTANLKFTLDNTSGTTDATSIAFGDDLDAVIDGLAAVAPPPSPCGGTLTGTSDLTFSGGSVTAGNSCSFDVTVAVPATIDPPGPPPPIPTPDDVYINSTDGQAASLGGTPTALDPAIDGLIVESTLLELTKEFTNDPVAPGGSVSLQFTLQNLSASETVTDIAFSDDLGAALSGLTATGISVDTCSGTPSAVPTSMFSYSGGSLGASASCTITLSLDVPAAPLPAGPYVNVTSGVTGKVGTLVVYGDVAEDELLVQELVISKEFTDDPTTATGTVTLEFTLTNLGGTAVSDLSFSDDLSFIPGLVATTLPAVGICGPGSALTGTSFLIFTGGSLAASSSCVIPVTLTLPESASDGIFVNRTSQLREAGFPVAPRAQALLEVEPPPTFSKSFSPDPVGQGFVTTLTFTIDNGASTLAATGLAFLDMLPVGLEVAATPMVTNTCGGSVVAAAGSVSISLSGGSVDAGMGCTISVNVTAVGSGLLDNMSGDLTSSSGNSGTASDSVTVIACTAADGANLTLQSDIVLGTEIYEVCNTIQVKQHYQVLGPSGNLSLTAGVAVILFDGVEFGNGSVVVISLDPGLIP